MTGLSLDCLVTPVTASNRRLVGLDNPNTAESDSCVQLNVSWAGRSLLLQDSDSMCHRMIQSTLVLHAYRLPPS